MKKTSLEKVIEAIKTKQSFILEAGAGSGKTYTLIQSLNYIMENYSDELNSTGKKIACITFTNVAKNEIIERTEHSNLVIVQTIHEFLWDCIKNYQSALHIKLQELNKEYERQRTEDGKRKGYEYIVELEELTKNLNISYTDYGRNFSKGLLTHEDIILISYYMFRDYSNLSNVIADKYPYVFVDEYQDTESETILSLLDHHLKLQQGKIVIGFFGDSMQKIYDKGVGKIPREYYEEGNKNKLLTFITKDENYRCSLAVINLLNKIRKDLEQKPAGKNQKTQGQTRFLYGSTNYEDFFSYLETLNDWNFSDLNTKVLFLTHTGIAKKLEYENLLKTYSSRYGQYGRDRLFKKEERFSNFFLGDNGVEKVFNHYKSEEYGEILDLLNNAGYKLIFHEDKEKIKNMMCELNKIRNEKSVQEILDFIREKKLLTIPDKILEFENFINQKNIDEENTEKQKKDKLFYENLMQIKYKEFINVYDFIENKTIFSTKHGTKGDEYENVLVIIDDGAWKQSYSFEEMFLGQSKYPERLQRTFNLFYVCCSRAKTNLVVASISTMSNDAMNTIVEWFGENNVTKIQ